MIKLIMIRILKGYKGTGSLVIFDKLHTDGDLKGKPICFWSKDTDYQPETKHGWMYDEENKRVLEPVVTKQDVAEHKLSFAHSLGLELSL